MELATSLVDSSCPYCGEPVQLIIDAGGDEGGDPAEQDYVEDCQVCCRPMLVSVRYANDGGLEVSLRDDND